MADNSQQAANAKTRTRSPSHPSIGLEEAIRRVQLLYNEVHDHQVSVEAVATVWDTNTKSSAFQQTLSTLKQFGLLDDDGKGESRQVGASELALGILLQDPASPDRATAIKFAALKPTLHDELWQKYDGHLPPNNAPIRFYLLRERENGTFHPDHVDSFISQFRSTIAFSGLAPGDIITEIDENEKRVLPDPPRRETPVQDKSGTRLNFVSPTPASSPPSVPSWGPPGSMRELPVVLPSTLSVAVVKLPADGMSELDFQTLIGQLNAMKPMLVKPITIKDLASNPDRVATGPLPN